MEVDSDSELLTKAASGAAVEAGLWPGLRDDIVARLDKIAHNDFPIPHLPPPPARLSLASAASVCNPRPTSPVASSSSPSPPPPPPPERASAEQEEEEEEEAYGKEQTPAPRGEELPRQIANQLADITARLRTFTTYAPHTIQRLAELVLRPRAHYKALASYLHAVDRVVQVTSGTNVYPLPPAIPDMSTINVGVNGAGADEAAARDPAATVTWSNPTTAAAALGSDEALGGALLTPIPWLTRRSPDSNSSGGDAATAAAGGSAAGARIHSEGTETIDGPNGMGRIETVSVSVNGVPSTGHARGVTQGELLRQEQRAGVVPVSQLSRSSQDMMPGGGGGGEEDRSMVDDNDDVAARYPTCAARRRSASTTRARRR
ncbi:hypothetical protein CDD83_5626 [Cordyceps sp. RAO-2017]|nr:hypothetical protein CDD83_5626 [Cordyceps sp. RAO-2017]